MADILIVEDDATIRETVEINLLSAGFSVQTAADGKQGLLKATALKPKIILLDVMLEKVDGFSICERVRSKNPDVIIIMVSALGGESEKLKGFSLGADDYITKPFSMKELLARIKAHLRKAKIASDEDGPIILGDIEINPSTFEIRIKGEKVDLRPKEFLLLTTMAREPSQIFSRDQLAKKVWGYDFMGASRTIDAHIQKIRSKVEKLSDYKLFTTVHGQGYKLVLSKKP